MMRYLLPAFQGIEPECAADALDLGASSARTLPGRVLVEAPPDFLYRANLAHPTATRVQLVLRDGPIVDLDDVRRLVADVAWNEQFVSERSFAIECLRIGEHGFTSQDVERAAGAIVLENFGTERPKVDLNRPDVRVVVHVRDGHAYVGLDTTGDSLHMRPWRVAAHRAPLNPCIASAMVRASAWRDGLLLDPMCGSGTIPIEADYRARGRAVNMLRDEWGFERLALHDPATLARVREELACAMEDDAPPLLGNEQNADTLQGARRNAEAAGASRALRFTQGDFNDLPRPKNLRALVTNPPWGLRLANRKASERVARELRVKLQEWAREGPFTAVVFVGHQGFEKEGPAPVEARDVQFGASPCRLLRYEF